jgi:hypothetical protein
VRDNQISLGRDSEGHSSLDRDTEGSSLVRIARQCILNKLDLPAISPNPEEIPGHSSEIGNIPPSPLPLQLVTLLQDAGTPLVAD